MTEAASELSSSVMFGTVDENLLSAPENHSIVFLSSTYQPNHTETVTAVTNDLLTVAPNSDILEDDNFNFILIPLAVLLGIIGLSALVYLMARNRRRLAHIYCKRKYERKFAFKDNSDTLLSQQNEGYDIDDPTECLLKGKLQIDNSYESTMRKELFA